MTFHSTTGYLVPVLEELRIPASSQLLVFSKTSCQRDRISPGNPRAVYFNDHAYVAWVPGSPMLEISSITPAQGAVFYTLEQKESAKPRLVRRDQCLECHTSTQTLNVPGYLVRSYPTDAAGVIDITEGFSMVDHRTPFSRRWGGWYLSGPGGVLVPRGQTPSASSDASRELSLRPADAAAKYPQATSDLTALLVLEHQVHMQNLITRVHRTYLESGPDEGRLHSEVEALVRYLLFVDEAALAKPVTERSEFARWFEKQGPRDRQGRSLRQFDLQERIFKFPCSFMIYSEAFDGLPRRARLRVYHRLWSILSGEETDPTFTGLSAVTRRVLLEILTETKSDVPVSWRL